MKKKIGAGDKLSDIKQISLGYSHSVALASDGTVFTWGDNGNGQLGDGSKTDQDSPTAITFPGDVTIKQVVTGMSHTIALASDGTVFTWGNNQDGQLGDGNSGWGTNQLSPVAITFPRGVTIKQVAAGGSHTIALASDGTVFTWGDNRQGELGDGNSGWGTNQLSPTTITFPRGATIEQIAARSGQSMALASDGTVFTWGMISKGNWVGSDTQASPTAIPFPGGATIEQIEAGASHKIAIASDGTVFTWGSNDDGELGDGTMGTIEASPIPIPIPGGATIEQVAGGVCCTMALASDGTVFTWGLNLYGELGAGNIETNLVSPTVMPIPEGVLIEQVAAGNSYTAVLTSDGTVLAWGRNYYGQLGNGDKGTDQATLQTVIFPADASAGDPISGD
ncbi:RCC1 domain-containing protein [Cytobacillus sp. Hm23]